ncbi:MAG: DUF3748 domain-containing protein [Luteolibacter sp.]|uniref:DUF3748 domain-containing protein n=1 Tax=Luteolibacter sp. TaxID=1962973 RepID=UPI0032637CD1
MKPVFPALLSLLTASWTFAGERILTHSPHGHLIHNSQVFSRDGTHIVFDSRDDETLLATSTAIGMADVATGEETVLYQVPHPTPFGPGVGAATFSPVADQVIFIHGLDDASQAAPYGPQRRGAVMISLDHPGESVHLDARDISEPFTAGALRGGTHAHHWSGDGRMISFTYNDAIIPGSSATDLRTVGVIANDQPVSVTDPRPDEEFSGKGFTVMVVPVSADPKPGSDELSRACEEGWVGINGYLKPDGTRQKRALAFIGTIATADGKSNTEVFIADLPDDISQPDSSGPLEGTARHLPYPPAGVKIRRLTHTATTSLPGLQGPRHWLRASPDGTTLAFLDQDDDGVIQIFGMSPNGGTAHRISHFEKSVDTPFTWSPDGRGIACSSGTRIAVIDVKSGTTTFLTEISKNSQQPRNGVVFSPDGKRVAYNRLLPDPDGGNHLQICLADVP